MPKNIARNSQCLMIELDEERRYFTDEENLPQLLEFCKSFDLKMYVVQAKEVTLIDIMGLPKIVCEGKKTPSIEFKVIQNVLPFDPAISIPVVRNRSHAIKTAKAIREKIRSRFLLGEAVSKDMLEEEFPEDSIPSSSFALHVRTIRKELEEQGYTFERISPSCYKSTTPEQKLALEEQQKAIITTTMADWVKIKVPNTLQTQQNIEIIKTYMNNTVLNNTPVNTPPLPFVAFLH